MQQSVGESWEHDASMPYVNDPELCRRVIALCRDEDKRFVGHWRDGHPSKWFPDQVQKPGTKRYFQKFGDEPWEFIAKSLEEGWALKKVPLDEPYGEHGYELLVEVKRNEPEIYIKLYLTPEDTIIARSFHYSNKMQGK